MFKFKEKADPVGVVHRIDEIEAKVVKYARIWDEINRNRSFWKPKVDLSKVTNFLIIALDDFVITVAISSIPGSDKKATVLDALDRLYEYTVKEAMPIWLRPFASPVKKYIIYILASHAIDWMVVHYQEGNWRHDDVQTGALQRILKKVGCTDLECRICTRRDK